MDAVWRGVHVGENNLSVQLSALRRLLAAHGGDPRMIVNVPGEGYRFAAEVTEAVAVEAAATDVPIVVEPSAPAPDTPAAGRARPARRRILLPAILLVLLAASLGLNLARHLDRPDSPPRDRLGILVEPFEADAQNPVASDLARLARRAVLDGFAAFEDMRLYAPDRPGSFTQAPWVLRGDVHLEGTQHARLMLTVLDAAEGRFVAQAEAPIATAATEEDRRTAAILLLGRLRPPLFRAEHATRRGAPRDAFDWLVQAQAESEPLDRPDQLELPIRDAARALAADPASRPAGVLLSYLLAQRMLWSPASAGDADGERALRLIDAANEQRPNNLLYQVDRQFALGALGRYDEAEALGRDVLARAPAWAEARRLLGEILMAEGRLDEAASLLGADASAAADPGSTAADDPWYDAAAILAFARGTPAEALRSSERFLAMRPIGFETCLSRLLEAASLVELGREDEARTLLRTFAPHFPPGLGRRGALRRTSAALPAPAFARSLADLERAGLQP